MARKTAAPPQMTGVLERLRTLGPTLPPKAMRIADFLVSNADQVVHMSVTEVAERTGSSEGSVVGLCQQVGLRGFQQLKIALASELVRPVEFIHEDLNPKDETSAIVGKIFNSGIQALRDTQKVLSEVELDRAVVAIRKARRVEVFGIGSAATIAEDVAFRLLRIGVDARVTVDSHMQAITAAQCTSKSAVLTVSHSGSTIETLTATRLAKEAGATTIVLTNYGRSPILEHSDIVLNTMARETQFRTEAMTSRIAQLAVVDALIAALALADYERSVSSIKKTFDVLSTKRV